MSHRIQFAKLSCLLALGCLLTLVSLGCARQESPAKAVAEKPASTDSDVATRLATVEDPADAAPADAAPADAIQDSQVKAARAESPTPPAEPQPMPSETPAQLPADQPLPLEGADAPQTMPAVVLSQALAEKCKVKVGDSFPDLKLPNPAGQEQSLSGLLSPKLTLVFFWNGKNPLALEQLSDMAGRYTRRLKPHNVAIVGINSGDTPQLAGELATQHAASLPVLCDADGAALGQVTSDGLPCCYLLDPSGKVLWFDTEYSPTTRRDLVQAVRFALTH